LDVKRLTEWVSSIEGLAKTIAALIGAVALVFAAITDRLKPLFEYFGFPANTSSAIALLLLLPLLWIVWRSYRRFATESRLEQPDKFTLVATTPESLIGRDDDVEKLVQSVARNRIVLLDGESGCGKSALVRAGLIPHLRAGDALLPVLIRDWGDDWVRGPLAATLDALYEILTPDQRGRLDWTQPPDLAAGPDILVPELEKRLDTVGTVLARRLLLIADQFDDY
jgi:hypothetical protein